MFFLTRHTYIEFTVLGFTRLTLVVSRNTRLNPDFCLLTDAAVGVTELILFWFMLLQGPAVVLF